MFLVLATLPFLVICTNETITCTKENRPANRSCCVDFFEKEGKCIPCPDGTFGLNCTLKCPHEYYGYLCSTKCNCDVDETCSPVHGCTSPDNDGHGIGYQNLTNIGTVTDSEEEYRLTSTTVVFVVIGLSTFVIFISVFLFRLWLRNKYSRNLVEEQSGRTPQGNEYSQEENSQIQGRHNCSLATSAEYSTGLNLNEELYNQLELRVNNTYCKSVDMDCMEQQADILHQQLQSQNRRNLAYSYCNNADQNNGLHTESPYDTLDESYTI